MQTEMVFTPVRETDLMHNCTNHSSGKYFHEKPYSMLKKILKYMSEHSPILVELLI